MGEKLYFGPKGGGSNIVTPRSEQCFAVQMIGKKQVARVSRERLVEVSGLRVKSDPGCVRHFRSLRLVWFSTDLKST